MGRKYTLTCNRCGKGFYSIHEFAGYCSSCENYRERDRKRAQSIQKSRASSQRVSCPECGGGGRVGSNNLKCSRCGGGGRVSRYSTTTGAQDAEEASEHYRRDYDKKSGCFITTACVQTKGLEDDCEQLQILRGFRDGFLKKVEKGLRDVEVYYEIAPLIVEAINSRPDQVQIYNRIYDSDIAVALGLIQKGNYQEAHHHYKDMVHRLNRQFGVQEIAS